MRFQIQNVAVALVAAGFLLPNLASARLKITEVMAHASSGTPSTANGDWWELTNAGLSPVNLLGYQWADAEDALPGTESNFFPSVILNPGQSMILLEEEAYSKEAWRNMWGISPSVLILTDDEMVDDGTPDGDRFSGLEFGGDGVLFYDPAGLLLDSYAFGSVTRGVTFELDGSGNDLGMSVVDENGAILAANGDIGSPGVAVVPEPTSFALLTLTGGLTLLRRLQK